MADMKIDVAQAAKWNDEVADELREVRRLLKEVQKNLEENPYESDPVHIVMDKGGKLLGEKWDDLCNQFDKTVDLVGQAVRTITTGIQDAVEKIENMSK